MLIAIPIISVPPPEPWEDKILPLPSPHKIPPIKTFVNKSSINAFSGIGINVKKSVEQATHTSVLEKNVLLINLYAIKNNGIFIC
jgi:hypothetical protein